MLSSGKRSAIAGLGKRQPIVVSYTVRSPRANAFSSLPITSGARLIDSTPPATASSISPARIAWQAHTTAASPEAHSRLTVIPGISCGSPASSSAIRATLRLSSPAWLAQPRYTSSISSGIEARHTLHRGAQRDRREVVGAHVSERPAITAHGGAHGGDDHWFGGRCHGHGASESGVIGRGLLGSNGNAGFSPVPRIGGRQNIG